MGRPKAAQSFSLSELLSDVLEVLHIESPIIIGNSIGGAAALLYAHSHPVRALILCNSGGLVPAGVATRMFCAAIARFFAAGERRAWWFKRAFGAFYRWIVLPTAAASGQREKIVSAAYEIAPLLREAWVGFGRPEGGHQAHRNRAECPRVGRMGAQRPRATPRLLPSLHLAHEASVAHEIRCGPRRFSGIARSIHQGISQFHYVAG
jgi:pimeloyl-ACP methyl ester carboxylesterase